MVWQKILIILSVIACLEATNIRRKFISKYNVTNSDSNYKGLCDKFSYIVQNVRLVPYFLIFHNLFR